MIVYLIRKDKLFSLILPKNVYGSYNLNDVDSNNKERMILNISEYDGKWVAYSNKNVKILNDNKVLRNVYLENNQFLRLEVRGEEDNFILYTSLIDDSNLVRVVVSEGASFVIGRDKSNAISCENPLISNTHAKLDYKSGTWILQDLGSQYGTFVNGKRVKDVVRLFHGDVIFIYKESSIFGDNY